MGESAPKTRVPVTFNWDQSTIIGYADVNMETGEVVMVLDPNSEKMKPLRRILQDGMMKSFSMAFTADCAKMSKDEFHSTQMELGFTPPPPHQSEGLGDV